MNILHIGHISDRQHSGVSSVVPKHIKYQSQRLNVALLNTVDYKPKNFNKSNKIYLYSEYIDVKALPVPFNKPDLVIFHEIYRLPYLRISKQLKQTGVPYVIMPHGALSERAQKIKKIKKLIGNKLLFNSFIHGAEAFHYGSEYEKNNSITSSYTNKTIVIGSGVDLHKEKKGHYNKDSLDIIYVGRLDIEVKGIDLLVKAASLIKDYMLDSHMKISLIGPNENGDHDSVKHMINKYKVSDIVTVERALYGKEKVDRLLKSDCFVQLSRTESQCLGLMEAMGLGIPCIATEGTTLHDVISRSGVGFPVDSSAESVADMLVYVNEHKQQFPDISSKSASYIRKNYAWEIISINTCNAYRDLIGTF